MANLKIPTAQNFLCCISLRNGVKLYGWIFLVGHLYTTMESPFRHVWYYLHCDRLFGEEEEHICEDWLSMHLLIKALVDITLSVAQICTSFLLLLGIYQKIHRFIIQWVVLQLILLAVDIVLTAFHFLTVFSFYSPTTFTAIYYLWKCVELYGVFICFSYYKTISGNTPTLV